MGKLVVRIVGAVGAPILSVMMLGTGVASADALIGQTYDDAAATISGWKGTPVVGTVSGGVLEKGDCIVTSWHRSKFLDASGDNTRGSEILVNLNCNNHVATPGHPGNSVASPDGLKAKTDQTQAEWISKNPEYCKRSEQTAKNCAGICKRTGLCEA